MGWFLAARTGAIAESVRGCGRLGAWTGAMLNIGLVSERGEECGKGRKISSPRQGIEPGTFRLHDGCSNH